MQNTHLSGTRVWGPGTDTNLLLTLSQKFFTALIIMTYAELKILAGLSAVT